ncbi:MAG: alpha-D-ribose 1-methylphosphonate 5-triphosphate diphosphatase [Pseudomonadota bacterium]
MERLIADNCTVTIDAATFADGAASPEKRLAGFTIRPGIVDFHGDGFERHLAPRRGALKDLREGLIALDAELAANGITTAVLAQFWSWEGGMRGPEFARRLVAALRERRAELYTDIRVQLRVETFLIDDFEAIAEFVETVGIKTVIFNDHLSHKELAAGRPPPRLQGQALKSGRSPEAHWAMLRDLYARRDEVPDAVAYLAKRLTKCGVRIGSHDDTTSAERARYRAQGADIAEFPETHEALVAAREGGDTIILGAPNIVRGGSHKKKISARQAVTDGLCDVLVSDYHYPAPRVAALALEDEGIAAWQMISEAPAEALGLRDRGRIAPGLRADLCVLDQAGRVVGTMVAGRWSFMAAPLIEVMV